MKEDAEYGWWGAPDSEYWLCPECHQSSLTELWREVSMSCEDCGEHDGRACPECDSCFDHVWSSDQIKEGMRPMILHNVGYYKDGGSTEIEFSKSLEEPADLIILVLVHLRKRGNPPKKLFTTFHPCSMRQWEDGGKLMIDEASREDLERWVKLIEKFLKESKDEPEKHIVEYAKIYPGLVEYGYPDLRIKYLEDAFLAVKAKLATPDGEEFFQDFTTFH